jgi:hypothetical protein
MATVSAYDAMQRARNVPGLMDVALGLPAHLEVRPNSEKCFKREIGGRSQNHSRQDREKKSIRQFLKLSGIAYLQALRKFHFKIYRS